MIDPRGPRFGAWITTAVLAVTLVIAGSATAAGVLLTLQGVVFALGSRGRSPYQLLFKKLVRPRLAPPAELEDEAPPRFAQVVGLTFAVAGALSFFAVAPATSSPGSLSWRPCSTQPSACAWAASCT
jgi:hypothetical protein